MKQLKRPTSLISHWFPVEMVHNGPKLCKRKRFFLCCIKNSEVSNSKFQTPLTLSSHNSDKKNYINKKHHIFRKPWTSAFRWCTLDTSEKCSNLRKKRLRLHSFGPLWTLSTDYQWEISEVGHLSCFIDFFVWFHIVCDRYTLDYVHFTFSDTIWPLSLSSDFGTRSCTHTDTAS